jgi:GNAT superfamily N-acetyltransferase
MSLSNFERMMKMAEDVFDVRNDLDQLDVNEEVIEHLMKIHPATVSEYDDGNGPAIWILLLPTTESLMKLFIDKKISEKELYDQTPMNTDYEAIYLCSAMVLEEYRGKGMAKQLCINAIEAIRKDHRIKTIFVWAFSNEGEKLAESIAAQTGIPLLKR